MTVSSETYRVQYAGNGVTVAFTVPWRFLANSHILAIHTDADETDTIWVEGTHYTLTGIGAVEGTLTAKVSPTDYTPATGERLTIIRDLPLTQTTDYVSNDDFPAQTHEDNHDRTVMLLQQMQEQLDRTIRIPKSSTDAPLADGDAGPFTGGGDMQSTANLSDVLSPSTSFANIKQAASATATGVVELATDAEAITGTDTARAITPANLKAYSLVQGQVYTPEMFASAAISAPLGTAAASVPNATAAMQACINALTAIGGGTMLLGPGVYGVSTLTIAYSNVYIKGSGVNATTILHTLTANSSCLVFAGAGILSNTGVSDLSIGSNETTFNKIAINVSDVSIWYARNINVAHYPVDGTMYRGSGGVGTALCIGGREHGTVENFQAYANIPLNIAVNINHSISIDSWRFEDFFGYTTLATGAVVLIDTGVNLSNVTFCGSQNWIGGKDGLRWLDATTTVISVGLYLFGIKSEQTFDNTGYTVNIQHNTGLYNLHVADGMGGDRNGFFLRKVNTSLIDNFYFNGEGTFVGLNLTSTDKFVELKGCSWTAGTTASISGLTLNQSSGIVTGFSSAIPSSGLYVVTGSGAANITGNAATVTTNANLTGPITSVGNATSLVGAVATVKKQLFTATGTYTPSTGMLSCIIECLGGGGGGGGVTGSVGYNLGGAGGSAGGYSRLIATAATIGASKAVTIGAGGGGGAAGSNGGTAGNATSVGSICVANGGPGGQFASSVNLPTPPAGPAVGTGDLATSAPSGIAGAYATIATVLAPSGSGASSSFGAGGAGAFGNGSAIAGGAASVYSSGGAGASANNIASNAAGGNGSAGLVFITEFCSQ